MNEQETIVDIIAEKRREADYIEETARGSLKAGENYDGIAYTESDLESALDLADTKRKEADRLEAAHKRERGDCAKFARLVSHMNDDGYWNGSASICALVSKAKAALAEPVRNCDVYTADELKAIFKSELVSQLPIANEHEKNLVTITATGVIDTLFATTQKGGNDAD